MICVFHRTDFDGKCAGAIVKHRFPDCEMYGIDYADEFDFNRTTGHDVIMVDFSLENENQTRILALTSRNLTWIDHHKTSLGIEEKFDLKNVPGIRQVSTNPKDPKGENSSNRISGCELTWKYFFPDRLLPYTVHLLGRYDIWDKSNLMIWNQEILPFQYGMRLKHAEPDDQEFWKPHFTTDETSLLIHDTIKEGKAALAYDENLSERISKGLWFPIEFEGFKFQAINRSHANSHSAKSIWNPEEYDAIMYFCRGPNVWRITMFTDKQGIDLTPVAKKFGGGGHSQACGFTTDDIMCTIPQLIEF